jgi:hypothetical protein
MNEAETFIKIQRLERQVSVLEGRVTNAFDTIMLVHNRQVEILERLAALDGKGTRTLEDMRCG